MCVCDQEPDFRRPNRSPTLGDLRSLCGIIETNKLDLWRRSRRRRRKSRSRSRSRSRKNSSAPPRPLAITVPAEMAATLHREGTGV